MSLILPFLVLVVLIVIVAVVYGAVRTAKGPKDPRDNVERASAESLRYRVPPGQDPVVVVSALTKAGFVAEALPVPEGHDVVVACEHGRERDRGRVREIIQDADVSAIGGGGAPYDIPPVRFLDEPGSPPDRTT
jgi:hypothetical protein